MRPAYDLDAVRRDFPILGREVNGKPLVYLDNAASAQTPMAVIDRIKDFYSFERANVHRGVHQLSAEATTAYEAARATVAGFVGLQNHDGVIFTRGTTEAINLVAQSLGQTPEFCPKAGDEILITASEHHSNIVPWHLLAKRTGAKIKAIPLDAHGLWDLSGLDDLIGERTRIVALGHVANATGVENPITEVITKAKTVGAFVLIDGAQSIAHMPVNFTELGADFLAFSGHKIFGPMGIGALVAKPELLNQMAPYQGGGAMIQEVYLDHSTYAHAPERFEAGTPNVGGAIGLAAALDYAQGLGMAAIADWEKALHEKLDAIARSFPAVRIIGDTPGRHGVVSLVVEGAHPQDIGTMLDAQGVAVRTGHHCAQPLMRHFGVTSTLRASVAAYNSMDDVEAFGEAFEKSLKVLGV